MRLLIGSGGRQHGQTCLAALPQSYQQIGPVLCKLGRQERGLGPLHWSTTAPLSSDAYGYIKCGKSLATSRTLLHRPWLHLGRRVTFSSGSQIQSRERPLFLIRLTTHVLSTCNCKKKQAYKYTKFGLNSLNSEIYPCPLDAVHSSSTSTSCASLASSGEKRKHFARALAFKMILHRPLDIFVERLICSRTWSAPTAQKSTCWVPEALWSCWQYPQHTAEMWPPSAPPEHASRHSNQLVLQEECHHPIAWSLNCWTGVEIHHSELQRTEGHGAGTQCSVWCGFFWVWPAGVHWYLHQRSAMPNDRRSWAGMLGDKMEAVFPDSSKNDHRNSATHNYVLEYQNNATPPSFSSRHRLGVHCRTCL